MQSQDDASIVMKGGRKLRKLPVHHVEMHVENEASGDTFLRFKSISTSNKYYV